MPDRSNKAGEYLKQQMEKQAYRVDMHQICHHQNDRQNEITHVTFSLPALFFVSVNNKLQGLNMIFFSTGE